MNTSYERQEGKDEWLTPPRIWKALQPFDLDPCQPINPPWYIAAKGFNITHDGLKQPWRGFVWCNPPYGKETGKWLKKMRDHNDGIALVFSRTDTQDFHDYAFTGDAALFIKGRLRFHHVSGEQGGSPGSASVLIAYGYRAVERLRNSGIQGKFVEL